MKMSRPSARAAVVAAFVAGAVFLTAVLPMLVAARAQGPAGPRFSVRLGGVLRFIDKVGRLPLRFAPLNPRILADIGGQPQAVSQAPAAASGPQGRSTPASSNGTPP